ncbi:M28 family peptidase [Aquibacillus koreensis]|uniref:M28 family peptidase n=1 Tax=Aquibacillus koreensis TaxID=279446 RepID=A0A9X3WME5_9BACI|nr:M28 family metallopeptidase [Aquibacillus koreensis]MCT2537088.1 M28 family peptidase [Aquibacillus koreensis]MDC3419929.1 M28 family peptidase [Aquibacillus koreensis]
MNQKLKQLVHAISGDQLMSYTEQLTKEVRLSGSDEELRAFEYAQNVLDNLGLETKLSFHDGYISIPVEASLKVDGETLPCITHSMSTSTGETGATGELVYVKDLNTPLALTGKVVLTEGIATPNAVEVLENAGVLAAIFINGAITHEMIVSRVWGNPTPETKKQLPKIPVISITETEGNILKSKLAQPSKQVSVWLRTLVDTGYRKIPTLIADLKGELEPEKFVLFSGHVDSWHYGAMDNGSANATMLEVARVIKEQQLSLRRSLRLAFWSGHSHGRYAGSTYYCDMNWEELHENCTLHVYIDSVGGKGATILGESNCMVETKDFGGSFVEALTGEKFIGKRFGRGGDQSFWGIGIPALFMGLSEQPISNDVASQTLNQLFGGVKSGGFGWWWHTTEDTLDKLDKDNLQRDCQVYAAVIYDACNRRILPINQAAATTELKEALLDYNKLASDKLDLSLALQRVEQLNQMTININDMIQNQEWSDEEAKVINEKLLALSHCLIPLNYVSGDLHDHDLAMNQPPLPLLKDITILAETTPGSNAFFEWQTFLKRRLNKVEYTLRQAIHIAESFVNMKVKN